MGREHREPPLDRAALVLGVDMVENGLADDVLGREAEHLREGVVNLQDLGMLVLDQRREPGRRRRKLVELAIILRQLVAGYHDSQRDAVGVTQVEKVQDHPARGLVEQPHLVAGGPLAVLDRALPELHHGFPVRCDHAIDQGATLDRRLTPERHVPGQRHDQAVAGKPADERVRMLSQQRFGRRRDRVVLRSGAGRRCAGGGVVSRGLVGLACAATAGDGGPHPHHRAVAGGAAR